MSSSVPDVLDDLYAECDDLAETQKSTYATGLKVVNSMIRRFEKAKRKLGKSDSYAVSEKLCDAILDEKPHSILSREFKEMYGSVVSLGKTIDRSLVSAASAFEDISHQKDNNNNNNDNLDNDNDAQPKPTASGFFDSAELARVIIHSLMRHGRFEIADAVAEEMKLGQAVPDSTKKAFLEMHECCQALEARDVGPALRWTENTEMLHSSYYSSCYSSSSSSTGSSSSSCTGSRSSSTGSHSSSSFNGCDQNGIGNGSGNGESHSHSDVSGSSVSANGNRENSAASGSGSAGAAQEGGSGSGGGWQSAEWQKYRASLHDLKFELLKLRYLQLVQDHGNAVKRSSSQDHSGPKAMNEDCPSTPSNGSSGNSNGNSSNGGLQYDCKPSPNNNNNNNSHLLRPIAFARRRFAEFACDKRREIERLAGSLLFAQDIMNSPYRDLYSDSTWEDVRVRFEAAFCRSHGFSGRDPLVVALLASNIALPKRAKYAAVMRAGKGLLEEKERHPPEINLGKCMQFHSTFVCPISKEQSTSENPPVLLSCGHVISRDAMLKMTRTRRSNRVKCPTCPVESTVSNVTTLRF